MKRYRYAAVEANGSGSGSYGPDREAGSLFEMETSGLGI